MSATINDPCETHLCPARECEGVTLTIAVNDTQCAGLARALVWAGLIIGSWLTVVGPLLLITAAINGR